jgi:hypothetical protein
MVWTLCFLLRSKSSMWKETRKAWSNLLESTMLLNREHPQRNEQLSAELWSHGPSISMARWLEVAMVTALLKEELQHGGDSGGTPEDSHLARLQALSARAISWSSSLPMAVDGEGTSHASPCSPSDSQEQDAAFEELLAALCAHVGRLQQGKGQGKEAVTWLVHLSAGIEELLGSSGSASAVAAARWEVLIRLLLCLFQAVRQHGALPLTTKTLDRSSLSSSKSKATLATVLSCLINHSHERVRIPTRDFFSRCFACPPLAPYPTHVDATALRLAATRGPNRVVSEDLGVGATPPTVTPVTAPPASPASPLLPTLSHSKVRLTLPAHKRAPVPVTTPPTERMARPAEKMGQRRELPGQGSQTEYVFMPSPTGMKNYQAY